MRGSQPHWLASTSPRPAGPRYPPWMKRDPRKRRTVVNAPSGTEIAWRVRARMGRILDGLEAADTDNPNPPRHPRWPRKRG